MKDKRAANRRFDTFVRNFTDSEASSKALQQGFLSVKDPTRALQLVRNDKLEELDKIRCEEDLQKAAMIPDLLRRVLDSQLTTGKWPVDDLPLDTIIGSGHGIPDPPTGIVKWRWVTTLCLVYLRRWPEYFSVTQRAYDKGSYWVDDETLLERAKRSLPPCDLSVTLDLNLVKQGLWYQSAAAIVQMNGYKPFQKVPEVIPVPLPEKVRPITPQSEIPQDFIQNTLWRANVLRDIGVSRIKSGHQVDFKHGKKTAILNSQVPFEESAPLYSKLSNLLHAENQKMMDHLAIELTPTELAPIESEKNKTFEDEMEDDGLLESPLKTISKETRNALLNLGPKSRKDICKLVYRVYDHEVMLERELNILSKKKRLGELESRKTVANVWSKPLSLKKERLRLKKVLSYKEHIPWVKSVHAKVILDQNHVKSVKRVKTRERVVEDEKQFLEVPRQSADLKLQRLLDEVRRSEERVLKRIRSFENSLQKLKSLNPECSKRYRSAETNSNKNHAFDELTSEVLVVRLAICAVIESVTTWRKSKNDLEHFQNSSHTPIQYPFFWDSRNILLSIPTALNFLQQSKELLDWYGLELPLTNNPFMVAVPFHSRPKTPRSSSSRILVDGKQVLRVYPQLAELRVQEEEVLIKSWEKIAQGPKWWPSCSRDLWQRIRNCETVVLDELRVRNLLEAKLCGKAISK